MRLLEAHAWCFDCGWECWKRNAHGVGAIHHRKTGHQVAIELTYTGMYLKKGKNNESADIQN